MNFQGIKNKKDILKFLFFAIIGVSGGYFASLLIISETNLVLSSGYCTPPTDFLSCPNTSSCVSGSPTMPTATGTVIISRFQIKTFICPSSSNRLDYSSFDSSLRPSTSVAVENNYRNFASCTSSISETHFNRPIAFSVDLNCPGADCDGNYNLEFSFNPTTILNPSLSIEDLSFVPPSVATTVVFTSGTTMISRDVIYNFRNINNLLPFDYEITAKLSDSSGNTTSSRAYLRNFNFFCSTVGQSRCLAQQVKVYGQNGNFNFETYVINDIYDEYNNKDDRESACIFWLNQQCVGETTYGR